MVGFDKLFKKYTHSFINVIKDYIWQEDNDGRLKRSLDDSEDEDDPIYMIDQPLKRSRYAERNVGMNIIRSGSLKPHRIADGNSYFYKTNEQSSSDSNIMKSSSERNIPIRYHSSNFLVDKENTSEAQLQENSERSIHNRFHSLKISSDNKENASEVKILKEPDIEVLGISPKESISRFSNISKRSPDLSSFKFKPSITSTISRSVDFGLGGATGRRPIKSLKSDSPYLKLSSNSGVRKRYSSPLGKPKSHLLSTVKPCGIRKFITGNQCFRLDEKKKYQELLQWNTSSDCSPLFASVSRNIFSKNENSFGPKAIFKSHLDPEATTKTRLRLEKNEESPIPSKTLPSSILLKSLEESSIKPLKSPSIPLIDLESEAIEEKKDDSDDDIIFMKEIPVQKPRQNELESKFQKSLFYSKDYTNALEKYFTSRRRETEYEIGRAEDIKRRWEEIRRLNKTDSIQKGIDNLSISYPRSVVIVTEEEEEKLPELTPEMKNIIERAFKGGPIGQVLAEKFNIQITRRDIHTLADLNWLNDEVINFYMNMIMERGKNDNFPSVYAFNTFFYSKLVKTGYATVKRWTKKVDVFSYDLLLIPVHLGMHWCLSTIDFREKKIRYYDSMLGDNNRCLMELKKYLESEHQDKKKTSYDVSGFSLENVKDIPQQMNGSDCGMFSCKFAEYLSRDAKITFTQENMPYFRLRMVYEIVTQKLM